jgi:ribosomal protein S3AE
MAVAKKKKRFFDVEIPIISKQTQMQSYELPELEGRFLKYDLTRMLKGKSMMLTLKVKVEGNEAIAQPKKVLLMPYFLRRMIRKGTNYVEDSFEAECKDAKVRIKPFLLTRRKVSRAVRAALRTKAKEELINYVKDRTAEELFDDILKNQIQRPLSLKLKKIYPLALCEIRAFEVKEK